MFWVISVQKRKLKRLYLFVNETEFPEMNYEQ